MAATEAAVNAVMEALGCKRFNPNIKVDFCEHPRQGPFLLTWTDRGCPVAVAAADAAVDADRASIQAETLRVAGDDKNTPAQPRDEVERGPCRGVGLAGV